jgi:hypothetical protein
VHILLNGPGEKRLKVVTYATHDFGTFQDVIHNEHGVPVKVLGWGTKWNGFMDKVNGVLEYCETLPDDEIIVFIDGFDSQIMRPLDGLEETFRKFNCKVLVSRDPALTGKHINGKIFGTCREELTVNSGLYMGENLYLRRFLKTSLEQKSSDDQRNFNSACQYFDWVQVDEDSKIFFNKSTFSTSKKVPEGIYFFQEPGKMSVSRWSRGIVEYAPFFKTEIALCVLAVIVIFIWTA